MSAFRNRANFREKTRERAANFVEFRCTAHAELGRRAPRALHNTHDVGRVLHRVSAVFGGEIARCRRFVDDANVAGWTNAYFWVRCVPKTLRQSQASGGGTTPGGFGHVGRR